MKMHQIITEIKLFKHVFYLFIFKTYIRFYLQHKHIKHMLWCWYYYVVGFQKFVRKISTN